MGRVVRDHVDSPSASPEWDGRESPQPLRWADQTQRRFLSDLCHFLRILRSLPSPVLESS